MSNNKSILDSKYVPKCAGDYNKRLWYEKDLMEYFDYCDYIDMTNDPTKYFEQKRLVNFDIIHYEFREDPLQGTYKNYQTINKNDIKEYPKIENKEVVGSIVRNFNRKDIWVEKSIIKEHFKGCFFYCKWYLIF